MNYNDYAKFWYYTIGVNVIPANTPKKDTHVQWKNDPRGDWEQQSIPLEIFDSWIQNNDFKHGLAIIVGESYRGEYKGLWLNGLDTDNLLATNLLSENNIESLGMFTLVEQSSNKEKAHIYYFTKEPLKSKVANGGKGDTIPQIEVKSGGKFLLYCAGGIHKNGSPIKILDCKIPKLVDHESLEFRINSICQDYDIPYLTDGIKTQEKSIEDISKNDFKIHEGENRSKHILRYLDSKKSYNVDFSEEILFVIGMDYNQKHCVPPYNEEKIRDIAKQSCDFIDKKELPSKKPNENIALEEYALSKRLMELYHFKTLEKTKEVLFWSNGVYRVGGEEVISKRSRKLALGVKKKHIYEITGIIQDETGYLSRDDFDKDSHIVNMSNGVFNLKSGQFRDHDPKYLSRVQIPTFYDENATCPLFDKFLTSSLEGDEKKIVTIWEMIALCLIKDSKLLEKAFMLTGNGSNGKSVLLNILIALFGLSNISAKSIHAIENNRFALVGLEGKLANISGEVGSKGITSTENLKNVISADVLDGEKKGYDTYPFIPFATLIFASNEIPTVNDGSDGFVRKFELIQFEKQFYGDDRDKTVNDIRNNPGELSGIFNKVATYAKRLFVTASLTYGSTVEDVRQEWINKSDSVQLFIDECLTENPGEYCIQAKVSEKYHEVCKTNKLTPVTPQRFNNKMESKGYSRTSKRIAGDVLKVWIGCEL